MKGEKTTCLCVRCYVGTDRHLFREHTYIHLLWDLRARGIILRIVFKCLLELPLSLSFKAPGSLWEIPIVQLRLNGEASLFSFFVHNLESTKILGKGCFSGKNSIFYVMIEVREFTSVTLADRVKRLCNYMTIK